MPNKFKLKLWWQSKQRKTTKLLTKSSQEPNHKRRVPCQTKRHSKPSSQCSKAVIAVRGALLAKGPDSSLGAVHRGSCSEDIHMEEEMVEVKVQEDEVEDGRDK